jgi:hypothetical protein
VPARDHEPYVGQGAAGQDRGVAVPPAVSWSSIFPCVGYALAKPTPSAISVKVWTAA